MFYYLSDATRWSWESRGRNFFTPGYKSWRCRYHWWIHRSLPKSNETHTLTQNLSWWCHFPNFDFKIRLTLILAKKSRSDLILRFFREIFIVKIKYIKNSSLRILPQCDITSCKKQTHSALLFFLGFRKRFFPCIM